MAFTAEIRAKARLTRTKNPPPSTRPVLVTLDLTLRIADRVAAGLPIRFALALEGQRLSQQHFFHSLEAKSALHRAYEQRLAERMEADLKEIALEKLKTMPAKVWILERRYPEYFGTTKAGTQVNVQVNTVVGLGDDVLRRAAKLVSVQHDKSLSSGQRSRKQERQSIVDATVVSSTPTTDSPAVATPKSPLPSANANESNAS